MTRAAIAFRPAEGGVAPAAWVVTPAHVRPGPALVAVHGISREAEAVAALLRPAAEAAGRIVVAPFFDAADWPRYQSACCDQRADMALLRLLNALARDGVIPQGPVDLAGFSGGAQFAHRFTWLHPERVGRLAASSAGWWTFPDHAPWPMGMAPSKARPLAGWWLGTNLRAFLDRPISVRVGALDDAPDANTRTSPELDARQGPDRLTRARRWVEAMREAAARVGVVPRIDFAVMPGCGHDLAECVRLGGLDAVFVGAAADAFVQGDAA
jgi:pimeloyl-ACP methyl ester carboxylesterase